MSYLNILICQIMPIPAISRSITPRYFPLCWFPPIIEMPYDQGGGITGSWIQIEISVLPTPVSFVHCEIFLLGHFTSILIRQKPVHINARCLNSRPIRWHQNVDGEFFSTHIWSLKFEKKIFFQSLFRYNFLRLNKPRANF